MTLGRLTTSSDTLLSSGISGRICKVADLGARLQALVNVAAGANPGRKIIANIDINESVDCDALRIEELASHLLRNALEHGAPCGPISFVAKAHDRDLEIAVWNDGNVIPKLEMRHLFFRPLWRPAAEWSAPVHGQPARSATRIGLHQCSKIVRAHLGTIGVTSSLDEGTQFIARIPCTRATRLN